MSGTVGAQNMDCYSCSKILQSQDSVLLPCSCDICICQNCARQQLIGGPLKYRSSIKCPSCKVSALPEHGIINGVEEAEAEEDKIVRHGFAWTSTEHSAPGRITNFTKLQACYNKLKLEDNPDAVPDSTKEPLGARNSESRQREMEAARFRFEITRLMLSKFRKYTDPLNRITFTNNPYIEMHLEKLAQPHNTTDDGPSQDGEHVHQRECMVCRNEIKPGGSVLRMCSCRNMLCRVCAIKIMIHQPTDTYRAGVTCPSCRKVATGVVRNVEFLAQCEDALIRSAEAYLTPLLLKTRRGRTERSVEVENAKKCEYYREMIRLFWMLGFESTTMNHLNIERFTSLNKLRFEVARLEEYRLNSCDIVLTYDLLGGPVRDEADGVPVGFLSAAELQPSVFFERLVLGQPGRLPSEDSAVALRNQTLLTEISRWYRHDQPVVHFNAVDKIVLTAMFVHRDASNPSLPYTFTTQAEVVAAVRALLQSSVHLEHKYIIRVGSKLERRVLGVEILPSLYESDLLVDVSPEDEASAAAETLTVAAEGQGGDQRNSEGGEGATAIAAHWRTVDILTEEGPIGASGKPTVLIDPGLRNLATPGSYQPPPLALPSGTNGGGGALSRNTAGRLYTPHGGRRSGGGRGGGGRGGKRVAGRGRGATKVTVRRAAKAVSAGAPARRGGRGNTAAAQPTGSGDSSSDSSEEDSDSDSSGSEAVAAQSGNTTGAKRPRAKRNSNFNPSRNPRSGADGMDGSITADSSSSDSEGDQPPPKRANTNTSTQAAAALDTSSDEDSSEEDAGAPVDMRVRLQVPTTDVSPRAPSVRSHTQVTELSDTSDSGSSSDSDDEELAQILNPNPAQPAGRLSAQLARSQAHSPFVTGPTAAVVAGLDRDRSGNGRAGAAGAGGAAAAAAVMMDLTDIIDSDDDDLSPVSPRAVAAPAHSPRAIPTARGEGRSMAAVPGANGSGVRPESNGKQSAGNRQEMLRVIQQQLPVLRKAIVDREEAARRMREENAQLAARLLEEQRRVQEERECHAEAVASWQARLQAEQQAHVAAEAALAEAQRALKLANEHNSKLTKLEADKEKSVWELKRDLKATEDKLATMHEARDSAETNLKKLQVTINQLKQTHAKTQDDFKIQRGRLDKAMLEASQKDKQLEALNSKVTTLKIENEKLKKELDVKSALSSQAQHMVDENTRLQKELTALQSAARTHNSVIEDFNKKWRAFTEENQELRIANQEHLQDIAHLKRKLKEREEADRKTVDDLMNELKGAGDNNGGSGEGGPSNSGSGSAGSAGSSISSSV